MKGKEVDKLVKAFEEMYKYYHGWHFAYEYPGYFAYYQMGGDLSVYFTPDFNKDGKVSVQINRGDETIGGSEVPYIAPESNGAALPMESAYALFRIVKPFLDENMNA